MLRGTTLHEAELLHTQSRKWSPSQSVWDPRQSRQKIRKVLCSQHMTLSRSEGSEGQLRIHKSAGRTLSTTSDFIILLPNETKYIHTINVDVVKHMNISPFYKKGSVPSYRSNHKTSQASRIHLNPLFSPVLWPLSLGPLSHRNNSSLENSFCRRAQGRDKCFTKGIFIISDSCWSWCPICVCQEGEQHTACKQNSYSMLQDLWD